MKIDLVLRNNRNRITFLLVGLGLVAALGLLPLAKTLKAEGEFATDIFQQTWQKLDGPGAAGENPRPYIWGTPGKILKEEFRDSPGQKRLVQYFDKGRMELSHPDLQPNFTGDGRLVLEMVTGRVQVGDGTYLQYDGCECPVAGASTFSSNPGAPSYRAFQTLLKALPSSVGNEVNTVLPSPEGEGFFLGFNSLQVDRALGSLARNVVYIPETGHNVPDLFWSYLTQTGSNGLSLFNWQGLFGLPLTEAYWTKVTGSQGEPLDILVQLYERRTLLYNPAAAAGFQVESGNVGNDYFRWRYETPELPVYEDKVEPSVNGSVSPASSETGTSYILEGSGFLPDEPASAWSERTLTSTGANPGTAVSPLAVKIDHQGRFKLRGVMSPFTSPSQLRRVVVQGLVSNKLVVLNYRIIGSIRFTPGLEASQPQDLPPATEGASIRDKQIPAGDFSKIVVGGFLPDEPLTVTLKTPLNRLVSWEALAYSTRPPARPDRRLYSDRDGVWKSDLPAPGVAEPGIYTLSVTGKQSGKTALMYFRTRAGLAASYAPNWAYPDPRPPLPTEYIGNFPYLLLDPSLLTYDEKSLEQLNYDAPEDQD